jgi:hypothetical protein
MLLTTEQVKRRFGIHPDESPIPWQLELRHNLRGEAYEVKLYDSAKIEAWMEMDSARRLATA